MQACSSRASLFLACKPVPRVQACSSGASLLLGCKPVPRVKLSNMADLKALAKEFAALLGDDQTFIEIYKRATSEKFGFLYITVIMIMIMMLIMIMIMIMINIMIMTDLP